ncbi:SCP-2 family sterol carrier protein [Motiliproteus coralliicola]|uniref:SCP-2 family sterol carrier protein n=1 Tax=Motiliproteus coralliicola TaxID=2283196 RepID=A0A369WPX7_9GAMM|nr:SCP2 sterol-binding domain-containing protein [Motiliproteus coralliicola]RDE24130.1 SCP-2 family sterol carrier protein [Motiliproteus coralliicola]
MQSVREVMFKLPKKFQPEAAEGMEVVFQFVIDDEAHYCLTIEDQQCQVEEREHDDPNVTLLMDGETFVDIISGELGGTSAYMSGRLRAEGNVMLATQLSKLFKR